jgi:hypothetical protein
MEQEPSVFTRMATPKAAHIMTPVSCQHCQQKQVVQVLAGAGPAGTSDQLIACLNCKKDFPVMLPDRIVGGPFLP